MKKKINIPFFFLNFPFIPIFVIYTNKQANKSKDK